jgi:hypothetical protein
MGRVCSVRIAGNGPDSPLRLTSSINSRQLLSVGHVIVRYASPDSSSRVSLLLSTKRHGSAIVNWWSRVNQDVAIREVGGHRRLGRLELDRQLFCIVGHQALVHLMERASGLPQ